MKSRTELIALVSDMLQRAGYREVNLVYVILRAMLREEETA